MSVPSSVQLDDAGWELPSHEARVYAAKAQKYALVIPVINEGERIRGQLARIKAAGLPIDVIVADGGSTDGSLDADFVQSIGVRAVLTKTGPGKLSAQLRMAYAWCLREGYEGIVTIDGNGKDGVEAVSEFIAKLDQGCDYVQGSRYLPGGEAENTPLERTIANRLIHAPLLSLAGRHLFTDTTNGFRAYSARYLLHPEVRPFREEFKVYNLLFYLTVRAGQLGLKVDHVPVVRRYPESGKVPTKIGGFGSKLALLGETVAAATGRYTPDPASAKAPSLKWPAMAAAAILLPLLWSIIAAPNYSPDSWAFYELSKTVFSDFYRFSHFRSYANVSDYSSAFAPLWPSLIAIIDGAMGTGVRTGLYLAFLSFFGFVLVSERIARKATGAGWIGLALAFLLLLGPSMIWDELNAGRTIPLQLLLYALVLQCLLAGRAITAARAGLIGFLAGLAVMNRFDAALFPLFSALMVGWMTRRPLHGALALAASLIVISPWIAFSLATFGTVFATDNSAIATSLDAKAFVTDWWPEAQPTFADDPSAFALKLFGNAGQWIMNGLAILFTSLGFAFASGAIVLGGLQALEAKAPQHKGAQIDAPGCLLVLAVFAVSMGLMMLPQILTGYLEYRYYAALIWAGLLSVAVWQILKGRSLSQRKVFAKLFAGLIAVWLIAFAVFQLVGAASSGRLSGDKWASFDAPPQVAELARCIPSNSDARVLVIGDDLFAAKAGALESLRTMMEPRNMAEGRLSQSDSQAFLTAWDVDYILVRDRARMASFSAQSSLSRVPNCQLSLFKLQP